MREDQVKKVFEIPVACPGAVSASTFPNRHPMTERVLQKKSHAHQVLTAKAGLLAPCSSTTVTPDSLGCSPANAECFCSVESYLKSLVISSASSRRDWHQSLDDDKLTSPWKGGPLISELSVPRWVRIRLPAKWNFDSEVPAGNAHCRRPGPTRSCRPHSADGIRFSNTLERPEQHLVGGCPVQAAPGAGYAHMVPSNGFPSQLEGLIFDDPVWSTSRTPRRQRQHSPSTFLRWQSLCTHLTLFSDNRGSSSPSEQSIKSASVVQISSQILGTILVGTGASLLIDTASSTPPETRCSFCGRPFPEEKTHRHEVLSPFGCQHWRCGFGCTKVSLQRTQGTSLVGSGAE